MVTESSKVFRGLTHQTIVTIVYAIIQLAYFSAMSRLLNKEDFGYYAIVSALSFVLMEISNAGLGSAIVQKKDSTNNFINTAFTLSIIIGICFAILLAISSVFLSHILVKSDILILPLCIMACALLFSTVGSVTQALFMKDLQFFRFGVIKILSSLLSSIIGVVLAYNDYGIYSLIIAIFLNFLFLSLSTYIYKSKYLRLCLSGNSIKSIVSYGGWLTASGVIRSLYEQMDRLITTRWISVALLGIYTRASGFVIHISDNVNSIFDTILFPILSGIQNDKEKLKNSYVKSSDLIFLMSFVFSFSMILLAEPIIIVFLGEKWLDASAIFKIVSLSLLFHPFGRIGDSFFRSIGIVKEYFTIRVIVCLSSIILIIICSISCGIIGLACAYVGSRIIDLVLKMYILNMYIGISFDTLLRNSKKNFIIIGIIFLAAYLVKLLFPTTIISFVSVMFFYVCILAISFINPKIFGNTFYDYLYTRIIKNKQ